MKLSHNSTAGPLVAAAIMTSLLAATASAATWTVDDDGADLATADYASIQPAIEGADDGDEVLVFPGTYLLLGDEALVDFKGKAITVRAVGSAEQTILDGNHMGRVVVFNGNEPQSSLLQGFTITNGRAAYGSEACCEGGGIWIRNSEPTVRDCIITGNHVAYNGGGVYVTTNHWKQPRLINCVISGNTSSQSAAGLTLEGNTLALVEDCVISNNNAQRGGGGVFLAGGSSPTFLRCDISDNMAGLGPGDYTGGGIYCQHSTPTFIDSTISENQTDGAGGGMFVLPWGDDGVPSLEQTAICANMGDQVSPADAWFDNGNNHVAATCAQDLPCAADLNGNDMVDVGDLLALLGDWGQSGPADLDGSGTVGCDDLILLLETFGEVC